KAQPQPENEPRIENLQPKDDEGSEENHEGFKHQCDAEQALGEGLPSPLLLRPLLTHAFHFSSVARAIASPIRVIEPVTRTARRGASPAQARAASMASSKSSNSKLASSGAAASTRSVNSPWPTARSELDWVT